MSQPPIAIANVSTVCTDDEVRHWVAAIQQFMPDFCAAWGLEHVSVGFIPSATPPPGGMRRQLVADHSDQAGALGYHEQDVDGFPIGYTFAATDRLQGCAPSGTLSHELWEMLANPLIELMVEDPLVVGRRFPKENADPVQADRHGVVITMPDGPNVLLSDFVLPAYYDFGGEPGRAYDYRGLLTAPIPAMLPGGYLAYQLADGSWGQIDSELTARARALARPSPLSRRYRCMFRTWQFSTAA